MRVPTGRCSSRTLTADDWPATDIGLMKALGSRDPRLLSPRAQAWRPWRSYAVMRLWNRLEIES